MLGEGARRAGAGKGERRCCSVACEPSESESSSDAGRRRVGVCGGGEEDGIVALQNGCDAAVTCYATGRLLSCRDKVCGRLDRWTTEANILYCYSHGQHDVL